jgi:hypothetical protein
VYDRIRETQENVLVLDAGSLFGQRRDEERAQSIFLAEETAKLGYDVFGLGEWDLNYGLGFLREIEKTHGFTWTNANVRREGSSELIFPPYVVREIAGLKVGTISVLSPRYKIITMTSEPDNFVVESPRDALNEFLPELREKADLIVLLAQMPSAEIREMLLDMGEGTGIDVCIEGHEAKQYRRANNVGDVLLLAANNQGKYVGQVDMIVTPEGKVQDATVTMHALDQQSPEIEDLAKRVDQFKADNAAKSKAALSFDHERPHGASNERFLGVHTCARCHTETARSYAESAHAQAFQALVTKGQAQNPECVSCHVVGFHHQNGYDQVADGNVPGREALKNVQCEACHGYGTAHARDGSWAAQAKASCVTCHDEANSPEFDYETYWAKIAH